MNEDSIGIHEGRREAINRVKESGRMTSPDASHWRRVDAPVKFSSKFQIYAWSESVSNNDLTRVQIQTTGAMIDVPRLVGEHIQATTNTSKNSHTRINKFVRFKS